jgi:ribose/xylose/arabinose/galactoside ABC-type transport system permease subunit
MFDAEFERVQLWLIDNFVWPLLVIAFVGFSLLLPGDFLTSQNITFLMASSAGLSMIALAEGLCLLSGNFDLSIAAIATFSAMVAAKVMTDIQPMPGLQTTLIGIFVVLAVGGTIGLLNGISIAKLGVNPFLQTLSFLIIFEGAVIWVSARSIFRLPDSYLWLGDGSVESLPISIPVSIPFMIGVFALTGFILKYTGFGRAIYAVGGDTNAADKAGIRSDRVVIGVFVLSGMLGGLSGMVTTGFVGAATPQLANQMLFPAFAATVIGGISIFGGRGSVLGALGGVILLAIIQSGLTIYRVDPFIADVVNGSVLLAAILLFTFFERYRKTVLAR